MMSMWFILRDRPLFGMTKSALTRSATLVISAISKSPFGSFPNSYIEYVHGGHVGGVKQ